MKRSSPKRYQQPHHANLHKSGRKKRDKNAFLRTTFTYVMIIASAFWFFSLFAFEQRIHEEFMVKDTKSLFSNREKISKLFVPNLDDDARLREEEEGQETNNGDDDRIDADDGGVQDPSTYLTMYGRHRYNDSFYRLPQWLQNYFIWHKRQTRFADSKTKYAVLTCLPEDSCGGLSDRLRPLPFLLMIAKRTNRVLCFHWRKNYGLEEFLQPVQGIGIDWRCPPDIENYYDLTKKSKRQRKVKLFRFVYCKYGQIPFAPCIEGDINRMNQEKKFTEGRFVSIAMYTREPVKINLANMLVQRHSYGGETSNTSEHLMPDLINWQYPEMIADIFRVMFEPVPLLAKQINATMSKLGLVENQFITAHVRARYPNSQLLKVHGSLDYDIGGGLNFENAMVKEYLVSVIKNALECGHVLAKDLKIFFISDHNQVTNYAISHHFTLHDINGIETVIQPVGVDRDKEPLHMEGNMSTSALDFYPVFEDLLIMGGSLCVSHGVGSFGSLGAGLGSNRCRAIHRNHHGKVVECPNEYDKPKAVVINTTEMMFGEQPGGTGKLVYDESKYMVPKKN